MQPTSIRPPPRATLAGRSGVFVALIGLLFLPAIARGQSCEQLAASLATLDLGKGTDLVATNGDGHTYQHLYSECDASDQFSGQALPPNRRCSTDKNRVEFIKRFPDRTVVFRSKMAVDGDGSPAACGPARSQTDQCETSLNFDATSEHKFVNAEEVPFAVLPLDFAAGHVSFSADTGLRIGDLAVIIKGNACSLGVIGDRGPYFRLGEGSVRAHADLGNPQCAIQGQHPCLKLKAGGSGVGIESGVTFILFPGTRPKPLLSQTVVPVSREAAAQRATTFFAQFRQ